MSPARVAGIIPAAGAGNRLVGQSPDRPTEKAPTPKALVRVAGATLLRRSAEALTPCLDLLVVAAPAGWRDSVYDEIAGLTAEVHVVAGGATRQASVHNAVAALPDDTTYVLVHDAARPLVPPEVCRRVLDALEAGAPAVVPAIPVVDSLRQVGAGAQSAVVDRSRIRAVQTPQGFRIDVLRAAHERAAAGGPAAQPMWVMPDGRRGAKPPATDDASLVEQAGTPVVLVEGSPRAFKVTTALDLALCELLAGEPQR